MGITWYNCIESSQLIDDYKFNHTTGTLATTFFKPVGEENPYFCFGCGPQKICNSHSRTSFSNQQKKDCVKNLKDVLDQAKQSIKTID